MTLTGFWGEQYKQQQLWHDWPNMGPAEREALIKDLLLHMHEEMHDVQRLMDQSRYHLLKRRDKLDSSNLAAAGVDVFKLLIALMQLGGVNAADFESAWKQVTQAVGDKWRWEQDEMAECHVLFCDIDGCIAEYTPAFQFYLAQNGFSEPEHINRPDLEPVKDAFHSGGGFRVLEPIPLAVQTLNQWRNCANSDEWAKRRLVLVTARPYKRYRRIYTDTVDWCKAQHLKFDHILFEHDKAEAVRLVQPAKIVAHIEDRGKHALEVAHTGVTVFKLPFAAPEERIYHNNIIQVADWAEIARRLET